MSIRFANFRDNSTLRIYIEEEVLFSCRTTNRAAVRRDAASILYCSSEFEQQRNVVYTSLTREPIFI